MFSRRYIAALAAALCVVFAVPGLALAFGTDQPQPVSATPSKATPNVLDGTVFAITKVGSTVVLGGSFTQVAEPGSQTAVTDATNGQFIVAFDSATGNVDTGFAPGLDGTVNALLPGPTPGTVYVGGNFNNVGGAKAKGLVLLDLTTGKRVTSFRTNAMNGVVETIKRVGNRLFVGGTFTSFAGQAHGGLVSMDATTGVVDSFVQTTVLTNHNWTPGSTGIAKAAVGVFGSDVSPDGTRMVIIGNFKTVDGLPRDQVAMLDLSGSQAVVRADWETHGYEAACYSSAYDTYVRDVSFSPDGTYFVIAATGGGNNTLCDAAARFETGGSGLDIKPTWVSWTGGDSYLSVAITGSVVYVGGHQRWVNNTLGNDYPGGGAVPRPGLVALDPANGEPLTWNPGRNPRGAGAYSLLATSDGLYVGSDTDFIGNYAYRRMKIAFFPLAGGTPTAATTTPALPGSVYLGGTPAPTVDPSSVLYRVNAAGPSVSATDGGPAWAADNGSSSPYHNSGSNISSYNNATTLDATVPDGTPTALFNSERWDPGTKNDGGEMHWTFPVPAGQQVVVRLYFANGYGGTASVGQRVFDVALDGTTVLDHFDPVAAAGGTMRATMRSFPVTSDGTVDITFTHEVENPLVNAIEIVKGSTATTPPSTGGLVARSFDGTTAGAAQPVATDLDWNTVRAPVLVGSWLYYAKNDGLLYRRTFDGTTFGAEELVDPYNDPTWSDVSTGSPHTNPVPYRGTRPNFYGELAHVSSMVYSDGRLYYTVAGQSALYYRAFSPDSGIVNPVEYSVAGVTLPQITGAFLGGGSYWYVDSATGSLQKVAFTPGSVGAPATIGGSPTVVSGPSAGGIDWRSRVLFLGPGAHADAPPVAQPTVSCTALTCSADGSGSTDPDGTVTGYSWTFGDGGTALGATATHTYAAAGTYPVVLTVTDDKGATSSATTSVTVAPVANQLPSANATASCSQLACSFDGSASSDPDGTVTGYAWDFGDGSTGSGATVNHTYAAGGNYVTTLTVTDDKGGTATSQVTVSPAPPAAGGVTFAGASDVSVLGTSATVQVPAAVQPGDLLVLDVAGAGTAAQTAPSGWLKVATVAPSGVLTTVWQRTAAAGDAGSAVTVAFASLEKADVSLLAYSGAAPIDAAQVDWKSDNFSMGAHTQPGLPGVPAGSRVLWLWNVKSSSTTSLTLPAGTVSRNASTGSGTGYVTDLAAESAQPVSGSVAGPTATADGTTTTGKTTMVALAISPASATPPANQPPNAAATVTCTGLACHYDSSGSGDPDGTVVSYAWDFGDGATATTPNADHTYAAAGEYAVTLTVTDDKGATATQHEVVDVAPVATNSIAFRGVSGTNVLGTSATVQVPSSVQPGDLLVLNVAGAGAAAQTPPSGWTQVTSVNPTGVLTTVWQRTAVAGDAGSPVTVTYASSQKSDVSLFGYAGAAIDPAGVATATDPTSAGAHTQPTVTASQAGSHVLWIWNVKSSSTTSLSLPDGTVVRNSSTGTGTGYVTSLAVESVNAVQGDVPGPTSTADGSTTTGRTIMVAIVLAPAP